MLIWHFYKFELGRKNDRYIRFEDLLETDPISQLNNAPKLAADYAKIIQFVWIIHIVVPLHTFILFPLKQPYFTHCRFQSIVLGREHYPRAAEFKFNALSLLVWNVHSWLLVLSEAKEKVTWICVTGLHFLNSLFHPSKRFHNIILTRINSSR